MLSFSEMRLLDWYNGKSSQFVSSLFNTMVAAKPPDFERLRKGFPEECEVFEKYKNQEGYLDDIIKRYEANISDN